MYTLLDIITKVRNFEIDAHTILAQQESTVSRAITLDDTIEKLNKLSLYQTSLFKESLKCIENKLFKSSHVMAWAATMDFIERALVSEYTAQLNSMDLKNHLKINNVEDLRDNFPEYQIITMARSVKLLNKNEEKIFHGLLSIRNECAHPSSYSPNLNETLGYVSQLLNRISSILQKN